MSVIETETQLEDALAAPNEADIETLRQLTGDIVILGAGGKMGPSLARRIKRAADAAGNPCRVIAVSRFAEQDTRTALEHAGITTIAADLLERAQVAALPAADHVFFLAGRKFGSAGRADLTWAMNSYLPGLLAERYQQARIVVFSTGNVYPFLPVASGGAMESDEPAPRGEYANSCLGRERIFEYFAREHGLRCLFYRLNYAVDLRYGVVVDIARNVWQGEPVKLAVGSFNVIWQGDANSYALRSLALCAAPPRILNVTGPETVSTQRVAEFFAQRFGRAVRFSGTVGDTALLSNAALCHQLLGYPRVTLGELLERVAHWVECGGASLHKPTKFDVTDGKF